MAATVSVTMTAVSVMVVHIATAAAVVLMAIPTVAASAVIVAGIGDASHRDKRKTSGQRH
jgi:hypothetical protein